jgi:hypothetical protein
MSPKNSNKQKVQIKGKFTTDLTKKYNLKINWKDVGTKIENHNDMLRSHITLTPIHATAIT